MTMWSGILAVNSVNVIIVFYIYAAVKEPSDKHEPNDKFLSNANASVKQLGHNEIDSSCKTRISRSTKYVNLVSAMDNETRVELVHEELLQQYKRSKVSRHVTEKFNSSQEDFLKKSDQHAHYVEIDEIHNQVILPDDLIFKILLLIPARFLLKIQLVCRRWLDLINSSFFITCHAKQSKTVLISRTIALRNQNPKPGFHVFDLDCRTDKFVKSMTLDILDILASYDGLILARMEEKNNSLALINLVTRKHIELPLGTFTLFSIETYSLTFCKTAKSYIVVHLFCNERGSGCEMLDISTKTWKTTNDLLVEPLQTFRQTHVSIGGLLYWVFRSCGFDHLLVMNVQDEKFTTNKLPTVCTGNDKLVEAGGVLGLVTHATHHTMQVWILDEDNGNWVKRHDIDLKFSFGYSPVPICCSRNGKEIVFYYIGGRELYSYNLDKGKMQVVYSSIADDETWGFWHIYTHRNTLASWAIKDQPL